MKRISDVQNKLATMCPYWCVYGYMQEAREAADDEEKVERGHCANEERETKFNELRMNQAQMRRLGGPRWSFEVNAHE